MRTLRLFIWLALLTGVAYPFLMTVIVQLTMYKKANGSLARQGNQIVGSFLIGQKFESQKYFWPRPSAHDYATLPSNGSNLGPTNLKLIKQIEARRAALQATYKTENIPSELLYASGSGLDPHITVQGAYLQADRVAVARQMAPDKVKKMIGRIAQRPLFGIAGVKTVNVLMLNLALDQEEENARRR